MKEILHPFIAKGCQTIFNSFSPEWVDLAVALADEVRPLIVSDFLAKYPDTATEDNFEASFAECFELDAAFQAALLYRISHALFRREPRHPALRYLAYFMRVRTSAEIYYSAEIGPRFVVMHGAGIVLGPRHKIGADFIVYQGATIGQRRVSSPDERVTIGDQCVLFSGAKIFGSLTVGNRVNLAANSVLLTDAESDSTYAGVPAVKVKGAKK